MLDFIAGFIVFIFCLSFAGAAICVLHSSYLMKAASRKGEISEETMQEAASDFLSGLSPGKRKAYDTFIAIIVPMTVIVTAIMAFLALLSSFAGERD